MAFQFNSIVDSKKMYNLYQNCQGYETLVAKFWDARYTKDFPGDDWTYSTQQYVWIDTRNGYDKLDGLLEKYVDQNDTHLAVMVREDKEGSKSASEVEAQAIRYAKIMVEERQLEGLYIQTTLGRLFRTWYYDARTEQLGPLFGGPGYDIEQYVDAGTPLASQHWNQWLAAVKGTPIRWKAPTLPSSAPIAYTYTAGGSASSAPVPPGGTELDVVWGTPKFNADGSRTDITFLSANGQYETLKSRSENWKYDASRNAMVWFCNTHQMWYAYEC
ncbi:hypothetical protein MANI_024519 [Metarhizium anisopliae]